MYLTFFDGLDSLIEYYIPLAKEYPVALLIYFLLFALLVIALIFHFRLRRKRESLMVGTRILMRVALASLLGLFGAGCNAHNETQPSQKKTVNAGELKPIEIQHERLSAEQLGRIKKLQETFAEVDKSSLEKWIDNFKRDVDPDSEIAIWERVARAYTKYCSGKELTLEGKDDVFQTLLMRSMTADENAVKRLKLKVLSEAEARKVMSEY